MYYNTPTHYITKKWYKYYDLPIYEIEPILIFPNQSSVIRVYGMEGMVEPHFHICTNGKPDICIKNII